jgi:hypothetical protein
VSVTSSTQFAIATSVTVPDSGGDVVSTVEIRTCSAPSNTPTTVGIAPRRRVVVEIEIDRDLVLHRGGRQGEEDQPGQGGGCDPGEAEERHRESPGAFRV